MENLRPTDNQARTRVPLTLTQLTGVLSTGVLSYADRAAGGRRYGSAVGGDLYAPVHQVRTRLDGAA